MKQRLVRVSMVVALALGMSAAVATPSDAAAPVQKCTKLTGGATFTPGLGLVPATQTIKANGKLAGCAPAKATGGNGVLTSTIKLPNASCQGLATGKQKLTGTAQAKWKNKKITKMNLVFTTGTGKNITVATVTGKVTTGLFKGKKVSAQIKFALKNGNCAPTPVKSITFTQTKPFVFS